MEINDTEPYVEIKEIIKGTSFIANEAKTYDEEKKVADKAPVDDIQIKELGKDTKKTVLVKKDKFNYIIKIGDFYFKKSATLMKLRITSETTIIYRLFLKISNPPYTTTQHIHNLKVVESLIPN